MDDDDGFLVNDNDDVSDRTQHVEVEGATVEGS
jgi:hypothetical protein